MIYLTENEVLERVDEYTLYCHYMGFKPDIGVNYSSPLRVDRNPSFSLFPSRKYLDREYMWKDNATGRSGDIFTLVWYMYPKSCKSKLDAVNLVMGDFGLGPHIDAGQKIVQYIAKPRFDTEILIKSMAMDATDMKFWIQFHIGEQQLNRYNVTRLHHYWLAKEQQIPSYPLKGHGYAYRIWDRYQLYFPHDDKKYKFRSSYDDRHLPGFLQLRYQHPMVLLTKSTKEVMMFDSFGYEAVASRGEHCRVPNQYLDYLKSKYKEVVVWQDNDGKTGAEEFYPELRKLIVPVEMGQKDPTDFCQVRGPRETSLLITQLTGYEAIQSYI